MSAQTSANDSHLCFPKDHKLSNIFIRNAIKISYSCMNNTKQITDYHDKCILNFRVNSNVTVSDNSKKCKSPETCISTKRQLQPLNFNHLPRHGHMHRQQHVWNIYGTITKNSFKTRYRNHTSSFQHTHSRNSTELSKHIWDFQGQQHRSHHFVEHSSQGQTIHRQKM